MPSQEEVPRLIDSPQSLMHRAILMTLYGTGVRRAELCQLKVADVDSKRMVIRVRNDKGGRDRGRSSECQAAGNFARVLAMDEAEDLSVPGTVKNWRADVPITSKVVWIAVNEARKRAGMERWRSAYPTYSAAQLCHAHGPSRRRPAYDPDVAGTCQVGRHRRLSASVSPPSASSGQSHRENAFGVEVAGCNVLYFVLGGCFAVIRPDILSYTPAGMMPLLFNCVLLA